MRCEVWVLRCKVWGLILNIEFWGVRSESEVWVLGCEAWVLRCEVWGVRCKVWVLCEVSPVLQSVSVTGRDNPFRWLTRAPVIQTASQYKSIMQESLSNFPVVQITNGLQIISNYRTLQVGCNCVLDAASTSPNQRELVFCELKSPLNNTEHYCVIVADK